MKKIFSLLLVLVLVLGSFSSAFAGESTSKSAEEIRVEMQKVREELKKEIIKNRISTRSAEKLTTEEIIQKENTTLPLKNKLADLDYELAKLEGRVIDLKHNNTLTSRSAGDLNFIPKAGDIFVYKYREGSSSASLPLEWGHANLFMGNNTIFDVPGINRGNSFYRSFDDYFNKTDAVRVAVISMNLSKGESFLLSNYINTTLLNKPYQEPLWMWANKNNTNAIYCSQSIWLTYKNGVRFVDLDSDGGFIVWPVDLIDYQIHGQVRYYDL